MINRHRGFTIVELLIVIVVIGILAAISIVAYSSVSDRANDSVIRSDLNNMAKQIEMYKISEGVAPAAQPSTFRDMGITATHSAYGPGFVNTAGQYNLTYCRASYGKFTLVAWSKSGNGFYYSDRSVTEFNYEPQPRNWTCNRSGIVHPYTYTWLYNASTWNI